MFVKRVFLLISVFILCFSTVFVLGQSGSQIPDNVSRIVQKSCSVSGCHEGKYPAAQLSLEAQALPESVFDVPSREKPELKIIDLSSPSQSYLLDKITGAEGIVGQPMPFGRDPLEPDQIRILEAWAQSLGSSVASENQTGISSTAQKPAAALSRSRSQDEARGFDIPPFWGTRLVNLPTSETLSQGEFLFRISHRFQSPVSDGGDVFYGLDGPAFILIGFGYGLSDSLSLTLGRSKLYQEWELAADWSFWGQDRESRSMFSAALHLGGSWVTQDEPVGAQWSGRFKLNSQLSLAYQLSRSLSVLLVPAFSSNTDHWETDSQNTLSLGVGGRWMFLTDLSLIAEWIPVLSGYREDFPAWGVGLEKKIGGHVFQFYVTNSLGLTSSQFMTGGDLDLAKGDFRLGFTIFRKF